MGTKRVGLARVQALINENTNKLYHRLAATKTVSSDTTLTAADSGKTILMGTNGVDITLPSAADGMIFTIIQTGDYATAVCKVTAQAGEYMAGVVTSADSNHGNTANGSSNIIATFGSATLAGDQLTLTTNGTLWFVTGTAAAKTNCIVFSDI